ncbi:MAG TPA: argininosuccinate lyase, partial [Candidatus Binatia bacterium]|nr:argininosuccinate lyase [Candidatus Binatia bacterium]
YLFKAHNVPHGLSDYKGSEPVDALNRMARTLNNLTAVVKQLNFNAQRALDEVNDDYATTTELADILQRDANVPFRVGHHFASELVTYGRGNKLRPVEIPYAQARTIYTEAAKHFRIDNAQLPLSEAQFRKSLTAENMVQSARVIGGPQPAEVQRMLAAQRATLKADREWLESARRKLDDASKNLDKLFAELKSAS